NYYLYADCNPSVFWDSTGNITVTPSLKSKWMIDPNNKFPERCGAMAAFWIFRLSKSAKEDGYIVQELSISFRSSKCSGEDYKPDDYKCYEAWFVKQSEKVTDAEKLKKGYVDLCNN